MSPPPSPFTFFKEQLSQQTIFETLTLKTDLMNAEDFQAVAYMCVLSTPYSTVLTINVFTQVELYFVCKKKNWLSKTQNPYFAKKKIMLSIAELLRNW